MTLKSIGIKVLLWFLKFLSTVKFFFWFLVKWCSLKLYWLLILFEGLLNKLFLGISFLLNLDCFWRVRHSKFIWVVSFGFEFSSISFFLFCILQYLFDDKLEGSNFSLWETSILSSWGVSYNKKLKITNRRLWLNFVISEGRFSIMKWFSFFLSFYM